MARYQLVKAAGGVTASWTTNQAGETNRPNDWFVVRRDFSLAFCNNICSTTMPKWVESKVKYIYIYLKMATSAVKTYRTGKRVS